jgi:hypothetical protein
MNKWEPNIFQRADCNYTVETQSGGRGYHDSISHQIIFLFKWINEWFLEATWQNITAHGRMPGRPNHDDMVLLYERGITLKDQVNTKDIFGKFECGLEDYTHPQVVEWGGFEDQPPKTCTRNISW